MGYHAPSAEKVYRYALRLDGERRLTDRFGWSIILVNDNSRVCREFLWDYCIDLCQRTADRIRFVFFSELPYAGATRMLPGRRPALRRPRAAGRRRARRRSSHARSAQGPSHSHSVGCVAVQLKVNHDPSV